MELNWTTADSKYLENHLGNSANNVRPNAHIYKELVDEGFLLKFDH